MDPISLNPNQPTPQDTISLDSSQSAVALSPETADKRARKIEFGLGPVTGVTKDQAAQAITAGQEPQLRKGSAEFLDVQKQQQKSQLLTGMMKNYDSLTPDQVKFVNDKYTMSNYMGQEPPTDPQSVMEEYYAGQYLKPMYDISDKMNHGSFMPEAQKQVPEHVEKIKQFGHSIIETNEIIRTRLEDAQARAKNQSYLGYGADFAKSLVPGYSEVKLRGNTDETSSFYGLRGQNLMAQAREDWRLPPAELKAKFNATMDKLEHDNPQLAVEYGQAMLGFSTSKENLNNAFTLIDAASIPAVGIGKAVLKGGAAAIRGTAEATGVTEALAKKADLLNQTLTATKDAVKSTEGEGIPLRVLQNQHFGQESARIDYEIAQSKKQYKAMAEEPLKKEGGTRFANEGLRSQALTSVFNKITKLGEEKVNLQKWHADGAIDGPDNGVIVNQTAVKDPVQASAEGRGDLKTAGVHKAAEEAVQELKGTGNPEKNTVEGLTDSMRADQTKFEADPGKGGQEIVNRLREDTNQFTLGVENAASNIAKVQRIPFLMSKSPPKEALEAIREFTKDLYPGIKNSILNISDPIWHNDLDYFSQKMFFGRMNGEMFASKEEAEGFAKLNGLTAEAKQQGLAWHLEYERPLEETMHPIRDWLIKTKEQETPGGWLNATVGWLRTGEDTLSFEQNMQRKLATYNVSPFMQFAKDSMKDVYDLGKLSNLKNKWRDWKRWERTIDAMRSLPDLKDPTLKGRFFDTGQELDDFYLRNFNDFPSITEKAAYFNFKRIVEYDRALRSIALYRNKARLGVESHSISVYDKDGTKKASPFFDGVVRKDLPGGTHTVMVVGTKAGDGWVGAANAIAPKMRNKLMEGIEKGEYKVLEVYDPSSKPLNGFANAKDARVRWVITKNAETKPITVTDQVPRRGGGHFEYDYEHYIKQASIRFDEASKAHWYEGDTTLMPITLRSMGDDVVGRLNKVRELIKADKIEEAKALATSAEGIPSIPWEDHLGWYQASKDSLGRNVAPRLNKDEAFHVVSKDRQISDMDNSLKARFEQDVDGKSIKGYYDGTKEGSLAKTGQIQYTGQRDSHELMTLSDEGTKNNPLYKYEPAKLVDPIATMNRSLSRIVNSTFMDDYKIYSVESWIQQAKNWLDTGNRHLSDIERSPFYYFNNPKWKTDMPQEIQKQLMLTKMKVDQLVGLPSKTDTFLHSMSQALSDSVYTKLGPKGQMIDPAWMLPKLKDPLRFARSVVFNEKMGLFSVPQFLVHAMTIANVFGIAGPKNAMKGTVAAFLHGLGAINQTPEIMGYLDKIAGGFGWRPGEFSESFATAQRTGFMNVAGEHAFMDAPMSNKLIQSKGQTFLDAGQIFFRGGVTSLRAASWHTAFKEFRDMHPTGAITDSDLKGILYRADLLSHNMSRASASSLTTGIMSVPAQFYTYQLRLFELMMGKRLSTLEKGRLFATNAVLFGAPVATGLFGYPFADGLRSYAQQNGYVVGDNAMSTMVMEGLPSLLGGVISGQGEMHKGNYYNFGERYGAKGIPLDEVMDGDKNVWQIMGGAAFNSLGNTWAQSSGLRALGMGVLHGNMDVLGTLTPEDFVGPFKEITAVNGVNHIIAATRYGNWLSKNNANLHPTSVSNSVFEALTGLSEQRDTDLWTMSQSLRANKEYDNHLFGMFQNRWSLGIQAIQNNDPEQGNAYFKEAMSILHQGGYPEEKIPEAMATAMENAHSNVIDRTKFNFYLKGMPNKQPEAYARSKAIDEARGEH